MGVLLPVEYTPLCSANIKIGQIFESKIFTVRQTSHDKTTVALMGSLAQKPRGITKRLLPGELWGWARALSPTFGRLNEVVLSRAMWDIHGTANPSALLFSRTKILSLGERHGLVFCTTQTETFTLDNEMLLLSAVDEVLLAHDCNKKPFFSEPPPRYVFPFLLVNPRYDNEHTVYFRWSWNESEWKNNIHTDSYARECGFKNALPEFVVYMDWIYHAVEESRWFLNKEPITIQLTKVLPLYRDETVRVITNRGGEEYLHIRFLNKEGAERVTAVAAPLGRLHF